MHNRASDPQSAIEDARQRLVKRNWTFSLVPSVLLVLLLLDLGWEILRANIARSEWPWTLTILGVGPAASLSGIFGGLILARAQFARSVRPSLSWFVHLKQSNMLGETAWTARLLNAGPGLAQIESVRYSIQLADVGLDAARYHEALELLVKGGLTYGTDYYLEFLTAGAPLPIGKSATDALEFAAFTPAALLTLRRLDFHVRVVDPVGDHHEKSLPFLATLPFNVATGASGIVQGAATRNFTQGESNVHQDD